MTLESCEEVVAKQQSASNAATVAAEESKDPYAGEGKPTSSKYQVVEHLGDGTFGRALKCLDLT